MQDQTPTTSGGSSGKRTYWLPFVLAFIALVAAIIAAVAFIAAFITAHSTTTSETTTSNASVSTLAPTTSRAPVVSDANMPAHPVTIELAMVGDILMHDDVVASGITSDGVYNYDFLFAHILPYINAADVAILNQETIMGPPERGFAMEILAYAGNSPRFNTPLALMDAEMRAGFNLVIKASNHTLDQGHDGLAFELNHWRDAYPQIPVLGVDNPTSAGSDQDWVHNIYMYEKDGFTIAVLNYTFGTNLSVDWTLDHQYVSYLSDDKIRADVTAARAAGADMLIACPHWGVEYKTDPSAEEQHYAALFCELGVDVIFGTHPHILQPVTFMRNAQGHETVCFFSNGNLVAGSIFTEQSLLAGISRVTLVKDVNGSCSIQAASLVPTVMCTASGADAGVYALADYTDALAAISRRPALTFAYAKGFCSGLYGAAFNPQTCVVTLDLESLRAAH